MNCIASIFIGAMFFSCMNNTKEVHDLLKDKNLPIGEADNIVHIYKDSGRIANRLESPLVCDYSNREEHPYSEFPKGLKITFYKRNQKDSSSIQGKYAITYGKTKVAEIRGDVVIYNYAKHLKLETNQLFWDQKEAYVFTEEGFRLTTPTDTIRGFGFESNQSLTQWLAKDITGKVQVKQNDL